jgi:hypothetical protein
MPTLTTRMAVFTRKDVGYLVFWLLVTHLIYRFIHWRIRISRYRRTMDAVPVIVHPWALIRRFIPSQWQTFNHDWNFRLRREYTRLFDGDIVVFAALFGLDVVFVANAEAIVEIATNPTKYPKDTKLYGLHWIFQLI